MVDIYSGIPRSNSYLIIDATSDSAFSIFKDKMSKGSRGLCITRSNPKEISNKHSISPDIIWFGSQKDPNSDQIETMEDALMRVEHFLNSSKESDNIILLERLDYLITVYGFEETLKFIYGLRDVTSPSNSTLLVHLNPAIISSTQYNFIQQEIEQIQHNNKDVAEDLKEIAELIREQEKKGNEVSFKDVTREFGITKTTARKRINKLESLRLIEIRKKGRNKVLRTKDFHFSESP